MSSFSPQLFRKIVSVLAPLLLVGTGFVMWSQRKVAQHCEGLETERLAWLDFTSRARLAALALNNLGGTEKRLRFGKVLDRIRAKEAHEWRRLVQKELRPLGLSVSAVAKGALVSLPESEVLKGRELVVELELPTGSEREQARKRLLTFLSSFSPPAFLLQDLQVKQAVLQLDLVFPEQREPLHETEKAPLLKTTSEEESIGLLRHLPGMAGCVEATEKDLQALQDKQELKLDYLNAVKRDQAMQRLSKEYLSLSAASKEAFDGARARLESLPQF